MHIGTEHSVARVVRIGERFAQLRLASPVVAARGDRVILRGETTLGGGTVLDPHPPRHRDEGRLAQLERGDIAATISAPVLLDSLRFVVTGELDGLERAGPWIYSAAWLAELEAELRTQIALADEIDPGVPIPAEPWAGEIVPRVPFERRGSKLYLPGAVPTLGGRAADAMALEDELAAAGVRATKIDDDELARFLEANGRLVRLGDGYAIGADAFGVAADVLLTECRAANGITLARFRDLLSSGRRDAQLLLGGSTRTGSRAGKVRVACCGSGPLRARRLGDGASGGPPTVPARVGDAIVFGVQQVTLSTCAARSSSSPRQPWWPPRRRRPRPSTRRCSRRCAGDVPSGFRVDLDDTGVRTTPGDAGESGRSTRLQTVRAPDRIRHVPAGLVVSRRAQTSSGRSAAPAKLLAWIDLEWQKAGIAGQRRARAPIGTEAHIFWSPQGHAIVLWRHGHVFGGVLALGVGAIAHSLSRERRSAGSRRRWTSSLPLGLVLETNPVRDSRDGVDYPGLREAEVDPAVAGSGQRLVTAFVRV